ncbi:hypothetical protein Q4F19_13650 [Sphingomonas sp. BIUV-7]|uniref:Uncharacterized protein n=1 Tax=Sphingomonas natans TaxID=3063330 RepID=A0ABT8YAS4_9SPHN|nr:hypothetical protein [Sphingomonas sp. BIUV-7]MDO6415432.1 hypothetical protein [Sphingomonas sp. BIUV-7]
MSASNRWGFALAVSIVAFASVHAQAPGPTSDAQKAAPRRAIFARQGSFHIAQPTPSPTISVGSATRIDLSLREPLVAATKGGR